jgi:hypothetical protein
MAFIHNAELNPGKIELLNGWLASQPWCPDPSASAVPLGAYRFDDPAGEVGIETHLLRLGEAHIVQVPLSYRAEPLVSAADALIGTMEHSVLGRRWVYDACSDPVYVMSLATAILTGGTEAELQVMSDGQLQTRQSPTRVAGSGRPDAAVPVIDAVTSTTEATLTTMRSGDLELVLRRVLDPDAATDGALPQSTLTLTGTWPGQDQPTLLAIAQHHR